MKDYHMNVAMAINERYVPYTYVMLKSLFQKNEDAHVHVYLLHCDVSRESADILSGLAESFGGDLTEVRIDVARLDERLPRTQHWPVEIYYRLLMPDIMPEGVDRVLYMDADIVVLKSLRDFYQTEFGDNLIIGCWDLALNNLSEEDFLRERPVQLKESFHSRNYINSGVLLINLEELRKKYRLEDYIDMAKSLDFKISAPDQDLINLVHEDAIGHVDEWKYNCLSWIAANNGFDYERVAREVAILHYAGNGPWRGGDHVHYELERFWWEVAMDTPYANNLAKGFVNEAVTDQKTLCIIAEYEHQKKLLLEQNARISGALNDAAALIEKLSQTKA
ncbi:MAG: glycosyltransferase family 8 protein [Eubacterium sp.]|nr:glycosyltransferase family 8 protein [Eubacterium sp.]